MTKSGFVALVGRPNVGKSTLMNCLIGQKIAITSPKPQTTRNRIQTVYTDERGQIVFLDTPGIMQAKNRLGEYMVSVAEHSFKDADIIMWLVEANAYIGAGEKQIAQELKNVKKPVVLVINKTDKLTDTAQVLAMIVKYKDILDFSDIVPISALKKKNTDELLTVLYSLLPEGPLYFDEDTLTDQPMRDIAAELIREQALKFLTEEIPHGIAVTVERMKNTDKTHTGIDASIICEKDSHKGIIIGKNGEMLKRIGIGSRKAIEEMTQTKVNLKLWVKVRKQWRDDVSQLKGFGYDIKRI